MSETETKKHDASDQKIQKQREEGNVANVSEISSVIGTIFSLVLLIGMLPLMYGHLTAAFDIPIVAYDRPLNHAVNTAFPAALSALALAVAPIIAGASIGAIVTSLIYNKGVVFSAKPLAPKLERISPVAGFKRMFGKRTWVEMGATLVRLTLWFGFAGALIYYIFAALFEMDICAETCAPDIIIFLLKRLVVALLVLLIITAFAEMIIQKNLFLGEQKMTDSEVKKEQKDNFGSNEVRQERSRIRQDDSEAAEANGVDKANMCFFFEETCVAIRYHPEHAKEPKVTAKATTREKSAELRSEVQRNGFYALEHEALVKSLKACPVGSGVPEAAYEALLDGLKRMFGTT